MEEMEMDDGMVSDGHSVGGGADSDDDVFSLVEKAHEQASKRRFNAAANTYTAALQKCEEARAVDLEVEAEVVRGRALCWHRMGSWTDLLNDAERLQGYDDTDKQAKAWLTLAIRKIEDPDGDNLDVEKARELQ